MREKVKVPVSVNSRAGMALIFVLWVLAVLMVIVLSFSYAVRVETHSTLAFKEGTEKKFLAEAGLERGIMELFYRSVNKGQEFYPEGMEVWKIDGTRYKVETENGFYTVRITDEEGKVDINASTDIILKNLLRNFGLELVEAETIADSIMDWKDPDDLHRLNGAESDYYLNLPDPYRAKNAAFDTLEELLLVKGVTSELLYGTKKKKGLMDFLTVYTGKDTVNLNAAPVEVLTAVPGITRQIADEIVILREEGEIDHLLEIRGIPPENYSQISPYISTEDSSTFAVETAGYKDIEKGGYNIKAIVRLFGDNKYEYLYYKAGANII